MSLKDTTELSKMINRLDYYKEINKEDIPLFVEEVRKLIAFTNQIIETFEGWIDL